jgi:hypothetical protein
VSVNAQSFLAQAYKAFSFVLESFKDEDDRPKRRRLHQDTAAFADSEIRTILVAESTKKLRPRLLSSYVTKLMAAVPEVPFAAGIIDGLSNCSLDAGDLKGIQNVDAVRAMKHYGVVFDDVDSFRKMVGKVDDMKRVEECFCGDVCAETENMIFVLETLGFHN